MASSTTKSAFRSGALAGAPFVLVVAPFAILFGVVATEAGLSVVETLGFSIAVIAGAAQFTALQLMTDGAPTVIVLASALAVNLRMAMYSASLTPWIGGAPLWQRALGAYLLVDQPYACSIARFENGPAMTPPERMAYFFGVAAAVCPVWYAFTLVGALVGSRIPPEWALDFVIPIAFLAIVMPMLRTLAHVAAAGVAIVAALLAAGLPFNLGLMVGGIAGMLTGARVEVLLRRTGRWT